MLKKSCAIILSIALAMGILVHGSFSYQGDESDIRDLIPSEAAGTVMHLMWDNPNYTYCYVAVSSTVNPEFAFVLSDSPFSFWYTNGFGIYTTSPNSHFIIYACTGSTVYLNTEINSYYRELNGWYLYYNSTGVEWMQNSSVYAQYASFDCFFTENPWLNEHTYTIYENLTGLPWQDNRVLIASVYEGLSVPYLSVRVDDMPTSFAWVSVHYIDQYGPGTQIFDYFDMQHYPGDDYQMFLISPYDISSEVFTVTSVLYSGTVDWGTKEVECDLTFNEAVFPDPIPSVTPIPDYNYFDTQIINYNGGQKDIFYNSFQVNLKRYEDSNNQGYFKDSFDYLEQPFAFTYILLPSFLVSQGFVYDDFVDDCFYQYDVIMTEYYDAYFDFFYGSGALSSLQSSLQGLSSGTDISPYLDSWYAVHSPKVYTYPYSDDSDLVHLSSDMPALLVVTDSFYFKQTNYLLGDTGDILSEFSERFYKVGGFSDSLFGNLSSLYNLNLSFFDSALPQLMNLSYFANGLKVNEGFDSVVQLLTSVDSYFSSVDSKLNYLTTIDSDINDLLEWFQNQEDSDVTLTFPDFNPSILIEYYGANIGDFVEFVQEFVNTLPSFDYSDFPNFFDYAADLVDDTAGRSDDLIGSLFLPYNYDDSGLHEFGWD